VRARGARAGGRVGPAATNWKGGQHLKDGYRMVKIPPTHSLFPLTNRGYIAEHRLVMAGMVNRPLGADETVHHIDGDKLNNDPTNLQLRYGRHGRGAHWRCANCGSQNVLATPL
jgi:hypothetical protein